ncbi:hypothetical protein ACHQM5_011530 [Ranunculus cassubicifolius]
MQSISHLRFSPLQLLTSIKTLVVHGHYPQALKASVESQDVRLFEQIYSLFVKSGQFLDVFLGTAIVDCFSKSGNLCYARRFLHDMPETDTVAWNTLISGYSKIHQTEDAFLLFNNLRWIGLKPDIFTLSSLVKSCDVADYNRIAHVVTLKMGFSSSAFICSGLINNYSKVGDIVSAEKCFEECMVVDNVVWTTMISGYLWSGENKMAQNIFMDMRMLGMALNEFCLTSVLGALSDIKDVKQTHCLSIKMGFLALSTPLGNALMTMYFNLGTKGDGVRMFSEIFEPDVISWAVRIGASDDGIEALELFKYLCVSNKEMNECTLINILSAIGGFTLLKPGMQIQARCFKTGYYSVTTVSNALITMYGRCQCIHESTAVFNEMVHRDCVSWNALLAVYAEFGSIRLTLEMFSKMRNSFLKENKFTLASVLEVLSKSRAPDLTKEIHSHMIKSGYMSDDSMLTCLIRAYGKCDEIENMLLLFSEIYFLDVVHLNATLATLVHAGYCEEALKLFQEIWNSIVMIDGITLSVLLKACGALTTLEEGKIIHSLVLKYGISQDNYVGSALVDVYCKCGSIDDGRMVFDDLPVDNMVAWNAMIVGYSQHGYVQEVFELFDEMIVLGIGVDEITCLGYLNSCCHSGLLKEASSFLNSMSECHGVTPQLEHYACLVDLLGRVGELVEAKRYIDQMPVPADAQIWQILLSACTIHGNVELGKLVSLKLLELQPENDSAHVVLSNLFASIGGWDEVRRFRKMMKENIIHKEPGVSWIQLKGLTHSFFANDTSHPEAGEIRLRLQELNNQIRAKLELEEFSDLFIDDV